MLFASNYVLLGQGINNENELKEAGKIADKFFQALTLLDQPEGKEMLNGITFDGNSEYPVLSSSNILYENLFDTDVSGVKGYKRLAMIKATSRADTPIELRYILISYKDLTDNRWKIFAFREALDISEEVRAAKSHIEPPSSIDPRKLQSKYRNLAYWEIMDGKNFRSNDRY